MGRGGTGVLKHKQYFLQTWVCKSHLLKILKFFFIFFFFDFCEFSVVKNLIVKRFCDFDDYLVWKSKTKKIGQKFPGRAGILGPDRAPGSYGRAPKTGAENRRARAGLKTAGLRKPGLQNRRAGRPGPVPIPVQKLSTSSFLRIRRLWRSFSEVWRREKRNLANFYINQEGPIICRSKPFSKWFQIDLVNEVTHFTKWPNFKAIDFEMPLLIKQTIFEVSGLRLTHFAKWLISEVTNFRIHQIRKEPTFKVNHFLNWAILKVSHFSRWTFLKWSILNWCFSRSEVFS